MARKRMVTRSIKSTKVTLMCLDLIKAEPFNQTTMISGVVLDEKKMLEKAKKLLDTDEMKCVTVVAHEVVEELYGMPELDFIANAIVLDKETRKAIEDTEDTYEDVEE